LASTIASTSISSHSSTKTNFSPAEHGVSMYRSLALKRMEVAPLECFDARRTAAEQSTEA
jgi:hypothetical protein